jgi:hypothetical protein
MTYDRIKDLTRSLSTGREYAKVTKRKQWVKYLRKHLIKQEISKHEKSSLIRWCQESKVSEQEVRAVIQDPRWRKSTMLNY